MAGKRSSSRQRGRKRKSAKQVRFLFSSGSPLTRQQTMRLRGELRRGTVRIIKRRKRRR